MGSDWNKFVSNVYHAGKKSNPSYKFSEALKDASKRKHEMKGGMASSMPAPSMPAASMPAASKDAAPMSSDAPMMMNKMGSTMGSSSMTKKMTGGKRRRMSKMTKRKSRGGRKRKGSKRRR